jgi:hypothetical protein
MTYDDFYMYHFAIPYLACGARVPIFTIHSGLPNGIRASILESFIWSAGNDLGTSFAYPHIVFSCHNGRIGRCQYGKNDVTWYAVTIYEKALG